MPLESGKVYRISSVKTGHAATLKSPTLVVLADRFEAKPVQFWKAQHTPAGFWSFENVEHPNLYLGIEFGRVITNGDVISGVTQPFGWEVKHLRGTGSSSIFRLFVPYTNQVLDLHDHGGWANGIKVQVYNDYGENQIAHQWWIDSDLALNPPVKAGEVYKIINCHTGTVVHLEDSNNVAGYSFNDGRNQKVIISSLTTMHSREALPSCSQCTDIVPWTSSFSKWEAISDEASKTWFFKNPYTNLYLSISRTSRVDRGVRVIGSAQPFGWDVAHDRAKGSGKCRYVCLKQKETKVN